MKRKILIIDDDKIFSKVLKDSLCKRKERECVVVNAYDGEEGLKKAREEKPDLIISDLMMPKVGGIEFVKKLKLEKDLSNIPILISTQVSDIDKISEATLLGVNGYIIKANYSLDSIVKQVDDILNDK